MKKATATNQPTKASTAKPAHAKPNLHKLPLSDIQFDDIGCPRLSSSWTHEERLAAVSFLVGIMSDDAHAGRFGKPGRVGALSIQYICALSAADLERGKVRQNIGKFASELRLRLVRARPPVYPV